MTSVSSWILSIAGIVIISVLVELVMPEGQMNKYIKSIFSFIIVLVIILPLPKIINKQINLKSEVGLQEITIQNDFIHNVNISKISAITNEIKNDLNNIGYEEIELSISANLFDEKMEYRAIYVNLKCLVISDKAQHKNIVEIKEDIKAVVRKYIKIGEVIFEE